MCLQGDRGPAGPPGPKGFPALPVRFSHFCLFSWSCHILTGHYQKYFYIIFYCLGSSDLSEHFPSLLLWSQYVSAFPCFQRYIVQYLHLYRQMKDWLWVLMVINADKPKKQNSYLIQWLCQSSLLSMWGDSLQPTLLPPYVNRKTIFLCG